MGVVVQGLRVIAVTLVAVLVLVLVLWAWLGRGLTLILGLRPAAMVPAIILAVAIATIASRRGLVPGLVTGRPAAAIMVATAITAIAAIMVPAAIPAAIMVVAADADHQSGAAAVIDRRRIGWGGIAAAIA